MLDLHIAGTFPSASDAVGLYGTLKTPMSAADFSQKITTTLNREPLHIGEKSEQIHTIAWCSGAAQGYIEAAAELGVDAYLSGEISEQTVHIARECGIHFLLLATMLLSVMAYRLLVSIWLLISG